MPDDAFDRYEKMQDYHRDPRWDVVAHLRQIGQHEQANNLVLEIRHDYEFEERLND